MIHRHCLLIACCILAWNLTTASAAEPMYRAREIFDPDVESHGHVHASAIVQCPNGDFRAVWYENGPELPKSRYYTANQDKHDNVRVGGSRLAKGAEDWDAPFVMSDTFGTADNNPTVVVDADGKLWLFYSTMLGAPQWTWSSSLLQYKVSSNYAKPGPPIWEQSGLVIPRPLGLKEVVDEAREKLESPEVKKQYGKAAARYSKYLAQLQKDANDTMKQRMGWMPRAHPLIRRDGTLIVPLSNENFEIPMMAMTNDGGKTWIYSDPVPDVGMIQPSLVELPDGTLQAYFRNGDPRHRIKRSVSQDGGMTWSEPELTDLLHPGGGIEAILLDNGHLAMVYNNKEEKPRDKLAVSISDDFGKTWKWTRQLEDEPGGRFDYPSIIQAADGMLHVTYSYHLRTIKHVQFNEEWVRESRPPGKAGS